MTENAVHWIANEFGGPEVLHASEEPIEPPKPGEVTIAVRAAGMNPADYKRLAGGYGTDDLPVRPGSEVAGVVLALGEGTELASGGGAAGDEVLAFRIVGGWSSVVTVPAADVFAKPAALDFPEAANLFLAGTTAAEAIDVTRVGGGDTVLIHGASGAVGVSAIQQAKLLGARIIGTSSEHNFDVLRRFGAEPLAYGDGLEERVRELAPDGIQVAIDTVGTQEATDVSLALVSDRSRIVTIAAAARAKEHGFIAIGGMMPGSMVFRAQVRPHLVELAAEGKLVVPIARTFPLSEVADAVRLLATGHPGGKLALIP